MTGSVPKIAGDIKIDKGLKERPVYFITVGGKKLVVKGEAKSNAHSDHDTAVSVKWSSKMMKNVNDRMVNTKIMDDAEVRAFLEAARGKFKPLPPVGAGPMPANTPQYRNVTDAAGHYMWVKMPMVAGLTDADFFLDVSALEGKRTYDTKKIKELIVKFTDEGIWAQMGKVFAVDIFNGNNDRFHTETGDWVNKGNLMFKDQGMKVIGLDTFDPNSGNSNLASGRFDALKALTDSSRQKKLARACTQAVGTELNKWAFKDKSLSHMSIGVQGGPEGRTIWQIKPGDLKNIYEPFDQAMAAGIAKGASELKKYLQTKVGQYKHRNKPLPQPPAARPGAPAGQRHAANRQPPPPPGGRPRAGAASPPRPNPAYKHVAAIEGMPQGILDRMHYLGWL